MKKILFLIILSFLFLGAAKPTPKETPTINEKQIILNQKADELQRLIDKYKKTDDAETDAIVLEDLNMAITELQKGQEDVANLFIQQATQVFNAYNRGYQSGYGSWKKELSET